MGSIQEKAAKKFKGVNLESLNKTGEIIEELKSKRIDAAILENTIAEGFVASNPDLEFNVKDSTQYSLHYSLIKVICSGLRLGFCQDHALKRQGSIVVLAFSQLSLSVVLYLRRNLGGKRLMLGISCTTAGKKHSKFLELAKMVSRYTMHRLTQDQQWKLCRT